MKISLMTSAALALGSSNYLYHQFKPCFRSGMCACVCVCGKNPELIERRSLNDSSRQTFLKKRIKQLAYISIKWWVPTNQLLSRSQASRTLSLSLFLTRKFPPGCSTAVVDVVLAAEAAAAVSSSCRCILNLPFSIPKPFFLKSPFLKVCVASNSSSSSCEPSTYCYY